MKLHRSGVQGRGGAVETGQANDRLCPAFNTKLVENRRDVRLDRGLRHVEFMRNLLVEHTVGHHAENPPLLWREPAQPADQLEQFLIQLSPP